MQSVTLNTDQGLYVVPEGKGYSCLGFDVLIERYNRLATELGRSLFPTDERGTLDGYARYAALLKEAGATGKRFACELSPQLVGLEGRRVEVIDRFGDTRRFNVGKSTGWLPCHLEIHNSRSLGGRAADREYATVWVVREVRARRTP